MYPQLSGQVGAVTRLGNYQSHSGSGGLRSEARPWAPEPRRGCHSLREARKGCWDGWGKGQVRFVESKVMGTARWRSGA